MLEFVFVVVISIIIIIIIIIVLLHITSLKSINSFVYEGHVLFYTVVVIVGITACRNIPPLVYSAPSSASVALCLALVSAMTEHLHHPFQDQLQSKPSLSKAASQT